MNLESNTSADLLKAIRDALYLGINGKRCVGYEELPVTTGAIVQFVSIPATAISAEITVDSAGVANTNTSAVIRYTVNVGTTVATTNAAASDGVPLGEYDTIEIVGRDNLNAFRAIAATHTNILKVQYFR